MKVCFKCNKEKPLSSFYKHSGMKDGFLNKCKDCTKKDTKERTNALSLDPNWIEKERARHREKYYRLNYKEKQKEWDENKPWKKSHTYKNLSRKFNVPKGYELHHWNYNDEFLEDVVIMSISDHRRLHKQMKLDLDKRLYCVGGVYLLDTREKHLEFIKNLCLKYKEL